MNIAHTTRSLRTKLIPLVAVAALLAAPALAGGKGRHAAAIERLTAGIPGGRLQVRRVELTPGSDYRDERHTHGGFEAIVVVSGRVQVETGDASSELQAGDAIHFDASLPHGYSNASRDDEAVLLWIATRREVE